MKVLAFDTALRACSAAVWAGGVVRARCFEERDRGHAEALVPMIEEVCRRSEIGYEDFDRIAVTVGPGTFAGVRIGVAAAKGLAVSLSVPLVGLTTLEVAAAAAVEHLREDESSLMVVFDARRGQVYAQPFDRTLKPLSSPRALTPAALVASLADGKTVIVGDGGGLILEAAGQGRGEFRVLEGIGQPDAAVAAALAPSRAVIDPSTGGLRPLYLRPPDARLPATVKVTN